MALFGNKKKKSRWYLGKGFSEWQKQRTKRVKARQAGRLARKKERTARVTARQSGRTERAGRRAEVREQRIEQRPETMAAFGKAAGDTLEGVAGVVGAYKNDPAPVAPAAVATDSADGLPPWALPAGAVALLLGVVLVSQAGDDKRRAA